MLNKKHTILEWVEKYPNTEEIFRSFDSLVGKCILCECLFESIEAVEKENDVDLSELLDQLHLVSRQ